MAMQISIAKKPNRGKSKAAGKAMQEAGRAQRVAPQALTTLSKRHRRRRRRHRRHRRGVLLLLLGKH